MLKTVLAGTLVVTGLTLAGPASAQRLTIGPGGPGIDLRSPGERRRDRMMMQRERGDGYYRQQRYREGDRNWRRNYGY